jgi:hypothetical protein
LGRVRGGGAHVGSECDTIAPAQKWFGGNRLEKFDIIESVAAVILILLGSEFQTLRESHEEGAPVAPFPFAFYTLTDLSSAKAHEIFFQE